MAGIKLPDYTSLSSSEVQAAGEPTPVASQDVARVPEGAVVAQGEAQQQLGATAQQAGSNLQTIIDTADVNNAIANHFEPQLRQLAQNFYSLSGKAAMDAGPAYTQQVQDVMNQTAEGLNGEARRNFLAHAQPSVDNELYRASMHSGQQALQYANDSSDAVISNHLDDLQHSLAGGDIASAQDSATLAKTQLMMHQKQMQIDPNSDIGIYQNRVLDQKIQENVGKAIIALPPDQALTVMHSIMPATSSAGASNSPYNLGNVKTAAGAVNNTADFVNPATPVDGVALTANTLRKGYEGLTVAQIAAKWTGESPDKVSAWVNNVTASGELKPTDVPNLNDPQQLGTLLSNIAVAEKSPADRKNFTPDIISQGVQKSFAGTQVDMATTGTTPTSAQGVDYQGFHLDPQNAAKITEAVLANKKVSDNLQNVQYHQQLNQFASDPHFVSMAQVPDNIRAGFTFDPEAQKFLEARAEYNIKNTGNIVTADKLQYGSNYYNLLQNIYTPGGISKASDLYQYMGQGGGLTVEGYNSLAQEISQKTDPQGQAVATMKAKLFDMGANAIYGQSKSYGVADPKGEDLHQKWIALALNDYHNGIKAGKSPTQLLDPESTDYVGKSISSFQRSQEEQIKDSMTLPPRTPDSILSDIKYGRMTPVQAQTEAAPMIKKMYTAGKLTKPQVQDYLGKFGFIKADQTTLPTTNSEMPRPE